MKYVRGRKESSSGGGNNAIFVRSDTNRRKTNLTIDPTFSSRSFNLWSNWGGPHSGKLTGSCRYSIWVQGGSGKFDLGGVNQWEGARSLSRDKWLGRTRIRGLRFNHGGSSGKGKLAGAWGLKDLEAGLNGRHRRKIKGSCHRLLSWDGSVSACSSNCDCYGKRQNKVSVLIILLSRWTAISLKIKKQKDSIRRHKYIGVWITLTQTSNTVFYCQ